MGSRNQARLISASGSARSQLHGRDRESSPRASVDPDARIIKNIPKIPRLRGGGDPRKLSPEFQRHVNRIRHILAEEWIVPVDFRISDEEVNNASTNGVQDAAATIAEEYDFERKGNSSAQTHCRSNRQVLQRSHQGLDEESTLITGGEQLTEINSDTISAVRKELEAYWVVDASTLEDDFIASYLSNSIYKGAQAVEDAATSIAHDKNLQEGPQYQVAAAKNTFHGDLVAQVILMLRRGYEKPTHLEIPTPVVVQALRDNGGSAGIAEAASVVANQLGLHPRGRDVSSARPSTPPSQPELPDYNTPDWIPSLEPYSQPSLASLSRHPVRINPSNSAFAAGHNPRSQPATTPAYSAVTSTPNHSDQENQTPSTIHDVADQANTPQVRPAGQQPPSSTQRTPAPLQPLATGHAESSCHPCPTYPGEFHHACTGDDCYGNNTYIAVVDERSRWLMFNRDRDNLRRGTYGAQQPDLAAMRAFLNQQDRLSGRHTQQRQQVDQPRGNDYPGNGNNVQSAAGDRPRHPLGEIAYDTTANLADTSTQSLTRSEPIQPSTPPGQMRSQQEHSRAHLEASGNLSNQAVPTSDLRPLPSSPTPAPRPGNRNRPDNRAVGKNAKVSKPVSNTPTNSNSQPRRSTRIRKNAEQNGMDQDATPTPTVDASTRTAASRRGRGNRRAGSRTKRRGKTNTGTRSSLHGSNSEAASAEIPDSQDN